MNSVVYSSDGQRIVSCSDDGTIRIWEAGTGVLVGKPLRGDGSAIFSVAISPDGQCIASTNAKTIRLWDALTGASIAEPLKGREKWVHAVAFSPNGSSLVSTSEDNTVRIWDTKTCQAVGEPLRGHDGQVFSAVYSRDGSRIVSAGGDCRIIVWDALTGKPIIGTGIERRSALQAIADDGSNLNLVECHFFAGWKIEDSCLIGTAGERRLWLPDYMHKLVRQTEEGLHIHEELDLMHCNGAAEEHTGFIIC